MNIKGTAKELYVDEEGISIITFIGNNITIPYDAMRHVDFCYASKIKKGFIDFAILEGGVSRFGFGYSVNELMEQTVNYIKDSYPNLKFNQFDIGEFKYNRTAKVSAVFGYKELGLSPLSIGIHQRADGTIYFNSDISNTYTLTNYEWPGPEYDIVTNSSTTGSGKSVTKKKGKALKIGAGALIGTAFGPAGTLVGAAMGAGSKGKEKTKGNSGSMTQQTEQMIEKSTIAFMTLINTESKKEYTLSFKCDCQLDAAIRCFEIKVTETKQSAVDDLEKSLAGIKALKELLDLGAITQEEFEAKKKQLLNQ